MNIEKGSDNKRIEPLYLNDIAQLWIILTIEAGTIRRIRLSTEKPEGRHSRPSTANLLKQILMGRDNARTGLKFTISGTAFQQAVWTETCKIPHGCLKSYQDIGRVIGCKSARAVGQALKSNPLPIIVPCHRVIGKNGRLTGFSCGIEIKQKLIDFEYNTRSTDHEDCNF